MIVHCDVWEPCIYQRGNPLSNSGIFKLPQSSFNDSTNQIPDSGRNVGSELNFIILIEADGGIADESE